MYIYIWYRYYIYIYIFHIKAPLPVPVLGQIQHPPADGDGGTGMERIDQWYEYWDIDGFYGMTKTSGDIVGRVYDHLWFEYLSNEIFKMGLKKVLWWDVQEWFTSLVGGFNHRWDDDWGKRVAPVPTTTDQNKKVRCMFFASQFFGHRNIIFFA